MDDLPQFVTKCDPKHARKRKSDRSTWKRIAEQNKRYESKGLPKFPQCNHNQKSFRCAKLTYQEISRFHRNFYKCTTKISQDHFILKYCNVKKAFNKKENSKRNIATKYYIIGNHSQMIPVCQKTFLDALLVKKDRIKGIMRRFYESGGNHPEEKRGGDRKSQKFSAKKVAVECFIEKLKCQESHYCRSKTQRLYLPAELNIQKLWRFYNAENQDDVKVTQSFFRNIFNTCYNIGFGSPRTDVCSTCISLQEQITSESDPRKRQELMTNKRIHRLKYKAFYKILQEEDETIKTITFDCQKNQPLPKLPDQSAYFSRQFNFYHFAIVDGNSKAKLNKKNVNSYYWSEVVHNKAGNQIVSAVYHYLQHVTFNKKIEILRVVCDGCSGQNKNTAMVVMLGKWLYCEAPRHVKKIELIYPIVGHSFIPPDRVFARIEKILKTKEIVTCPAEYVSVLAENATVVDLSTIPVYDWKKAYERIIKPTTSWHFPFMKSKRIFITRSKFDNVLVQGEINYKSELNGKKRITKKNKKITMLSPELVLANINFPIKAKVDDVVKLLEKHFGTDWRNLSTLEYYKNIEARLHANVETFSSFDTENNVEEHYCEYGFEDVETHI